MLEVQDEKIPLTIHDRGVPRVAGTRVTLACVVEMFEDGASPEEIVEQYDALRLSTTSMRSSPTTCNIGPKREAS